MTDQQRDVFLAFAQGRNMHRKDIQPVEEIGTELLVLDHQAQIAIVARLDRGALRWVRNIPPPSRAWGTHADAKTIAEAFKQSKRVLIEGRPGDGKTETARQYAEDYGKDYYDVLWCNAQWRCIDFVVLRLGREAQTGQADTG